MALLCKAFAYQSCSNKKNVVRTNICCHDCEEYKNCKVRCENRPSICGKSEQGEIVQPVGHTQVRQVAKYNAETGELIAVYVSAKVAASINGINESTLYHALGKKDGTCNGFIWRYYNG